MSSRDLIKRGEKHASPLGTTVFVLLRALDPFLQYGILAHGVGAPLLARVGLKTITDAPPLHTGIDFIDALQLSPYRFILLTMATGSAIKQIFWLLYTSKEAFPAGAAATVAAFNTALNSVNSLLATTTLAASVSGSLSQANVIIGASLYAIGILLETVSEVQRKWFKDEPKNEGKLCTEGLWSLTRHINYTGYSAWRAGYSLVSASWPAGAVAGAWLVSDFATRAIPVMDEYASKRYGQQWANYKHKTPYKLIPGIW